MAVKWIFLLLALWMVFAQSCMQFRTSDKKAGRSFTQKQVPLTIVYHTVGNYTLHYAKTGADTLPTMVFIHGSPGSWDAFADYLNDKHLLQRYRMISVDRPGFGYSQFGEAKNLAEQSAMFQSLLAEWSGNQKPVVLVGHSLGGPLALRMALDADAGIVEAVVLLAASIDPAAEMPERWRGMMRHTPFRFLLPGAFRPSNDELWWLKHDLVQLDKDLSHLETPVWIAHGKKDMLVPFSNVGYAQRKFPALIRDTLIWEDANHFIPWSHQADVKRFLLGLPLD